MKLETRGSRQRILSAVVIILTFCFLLLLSKGFVTSGDDWFFTSRTMDESFFEALQKAWANATGHYRGTNGRLLGNGFSKGFGCSELFRELARCGIILTILLQLCRTAKVRSLVLYSVTLMLTVALPTELYAQSYAWAAGFFNYVPPLVVILAYILRVSTLLRGGKDSALWGFAMLLMLLAGQLFVENVTIGMCLLTGGVLIWHLASKRGLRWSLVGALAGSVLGCIIMFSAPGYANVNQEGYRQVSATFEELMKVIKSNFAVITGYLTEDNWLVIVPLTALSIYLLASVQRKTVLVHGALTGLMICPVYFYAHHELLGQLHYSEWVSELSFWLDVAANLVYLICVLTAVLLGVADADRKCRAVLCICAVPAVFGPLVVVYPIGPRCLYIPYMLLVCLVLILAAEVLENLPKKALRCIQAPAIATVCCVLCAYLWIAVWNGHCEQVRTRQIETAMAAGSSTVELPSFPYGAYLHNGNGSAMQYYYYYETPGDLQLVFIDPATWYLSR